jgi:hypothetical protein
VTDAQEMARHLSRLGKVKAGTLRFWGYWFGRPYDNYHTLVTSAADGEVLRLQFNEQETLSVWTPSGLEVNAEIFRISEASQIRWEWFYYGQPKTDENRYFFEFVRGESGIQSSSNANWCLPDFRTDANMPAVEIL